MHAREGTYNTLRVFFETESLKIVLYFSYFVMEWIPENKQYFSVLFKIYIHFTFYSYTYSVFALKQIFLVTHFDCHIHITYENTQNRYVPPPTYDVIYIVGCHLPVYVQNKLNKNYLF